MNYEKFDDVAAKKIGFYVYALVDPRTNKVFYVGKGKKNRWYDHIDSANNSKSKSCKLFGCTLCSHIFALIQALLK